MRNKRFGILVLLALLSLSNCAMAEDINFDFGQDTTFEKIKANKDTISKAQDAMDNKDYQTAVNLLTAYINEKPKKYEAYKLRGDAYYALRRYYMAQKDYQTAIDIKSSEDKFMTNTKYVSAIVLGADKNEQKQNAELGDLYGALMYAQKAMNNPNYTASYDNAVKYNSHIYLPQPNKNEINKINCPQKYGKVLTPQGIDVQIYGAIDDIAKGNYNESLYKLQSVTTQYPNYYLGHYLTGVALSELEKDEDAIKEFEKAISLNPYDFESRASLGRIYYSKAETKFSQEDARKSVDYFNQAIKQNKNCPTYYFYIGMNELQIGNTNVAISNFDKALKINPDDYNSQYYKLIAQYINGNYQDVVNGASKLLLKHVSNYNSVLYLRALAYTKLNENEKALEDLNTIENNIGDIYNADIKTTSAREKSLESYVHYLKAQIQHSKGAGSAEDNTIAYSNPIIDRLSNAQKAMEPYEKSLHGENISLSDYNKFESFYSTSLPKLLESGAVITYEDIDNQYDYIRTTFADLGISFLYLNPDYKMTTIKDYPYKKYSSKLNMSEMQSLSPRPVSESTNVELARAQSETLRKSTPASELIIQEGQQSLAQMLASNDLPNKTKPVEIRETIILRDATKEIIAKPQFKPELPDAEKIDSSKNVASGDTYVRENPLVNQDNSKSVTKILNEEKTIQAQIPEIKQETNVETASDGSVKISVNNPISTPDVVIKNKPEPVPVVAKTVTEKSDGITEKIASETTKNLPDLEPLKFHAKELKPTEDVTIRYPKVTSVSTPVQTVADTAKVVSQTEENVKLSAKEAKKLAKEQLKAEKEAAKLAQKEAKLKLREEKEALKLAQQETEQLQKSAQEVVENTQHQVEQKQDSMREPIQTTVDTTENIVAEAKPQVREIVEKHANIGSDINIQKPSNSLTVDNINDIVELDVSSLDKKIGNESDLFDSSTIFAKPTSEVKELTPAVTIAEVPDEKPVTQPVEQTVEQKPVEKTDTKVSVVDVPEITVPEIRTEKEAVKESKPAQVVEQSAEQIPEKAEQIAEKIAEIEPESAPVQTDGEFVKEQLSQMIKPYTQKQQDNEPLSVSSTMSDVEMTMSEANNLKSKRLKLKEEAKYAKAQKKAQALKEKEEKKLEKEKERIALMAQRDAIKEQEKAQKNLEKEKIAQARKELKQQKALAKEQKKLEQQTKLAQEKISASAETTKQTTKSWLKSKISKSETLSEQKVEKTAQQIRAEELKQVKKLEKEKAKQKKALLKEQAKIAEQNDETKIQRLKAKLTAMRGSLTSEEKKAQKEQLKKEREFAKRVQKAKKLATEIPEISAEDVDRLLQEQLKQEQKVVTDLPKEALKQQQDNEKALKEQAKAEQKAQKEAIKQQQAHEKALKKQQKAEQKAIAQAQKMAEKDRKAHEKLVSQYSAETESGFKKFISKLKFWKKK